MTRSRRDPLPGNRLAKAILSLQPTAYWPLDDGSGPLRSLAQSWPATVTGSPTYGVAAPSPIGRGVTWSGTGQYALTSTSVPDPVTGMSLVAFCRSTQAGEGRMALIAGASATSMEVVTLTDVPYMLVRAGDTSIHGSSVCGSAASIITGQWVMVAGTFDSVTARGYRADASGFFAASDASVSGTWGASLNGLTIGQYVGGSYWNGSMAHVAYFQRAVPETSLRHIASIAFGG